MVSEYELKTVRTIVVKQARIVKRASGWYVMLSFQWGVSVPQPTPSPEAVGIDVGLISFIATSSGLTLPRPRFFVDLQRKLKLLQQRVNRKKLGSNNWRKAQTKVAKLHEHISNTRKNFHWRTAHLLCNQAGMIFVEDLNCKALAAGMLAKHCLDAAWGQFFNILKQCCFKRGVFFMEVDSRKTSQICPNCGVETGKKDLSERIHKCNSCGYTTDRDVAAAQVVLRRGLAAVGHTVKMLPGGQGRWTPYELRIFALIGRRVSNSANEQGRVWIPQLELYLGIWSPERLGQTMNWLRWWDDVGNLLLWSSEQAEQESQGLSKKAKGLTKKAKGLTRKAKGLTRKAKGHNDWRLSCANWELIQIER